VPQSEDISVIVDNVAAGVPREEILPNYAALTDPDIDAALAYAAELTRGHRGFAAGNQSLKFKVDENLPTEYASRRSFVGRVSKRIRFPTRNLIISMTQCYDYVI